MLSAMPPLNLRLQQTLSRAAHWWVTHLPRFSFRILLVVFFGCVILFTTRPPKVSVGLQSAINPQPTSAPSIEKLMVYPWLSARNMAKTAPLCDRIAPPEGFERMKIASGSFADWLRRLPTQPSDTPVT